MSLQGGPVEAFCDYVDKVRLTHGAAIFVVHVGVGVEAEISRIYHAHLELIFENDFDSDVKVTMPIVKHVFKHNSIGNFVQFNFNEIGGLFSLAIVIDWFTRGRGLDLVDLQGIAWKS